MCALLPWRVDDTREQEMWGELSYLFFSSSIEKPFSLYSCECSMSGQTMSAGKRDRNGEERKKDTLRRTERWEKEKSFLIQTLQRERDSSFASVYRLYADFCCCFFCVFCTHIMMMEKCREIMSYDDSEAKSFSTL